MAEDFGIDPELVQEFVDESEELLNDVTNMFIALESNPDDREAIDQIFRTVHTIKGNSAFFNLMKVKSLAHSMEDLMNLVRDGKTKFNETVSDVLIRGIDFLRGMLESVREGKPEVSSEEDFDSILKEITQHVDDAKGADPNAVWKEILKDIEKFNQQFNVEDASLKETWGRIKSNITIVSPVAEGAETAEEVPQQVTVDEAAPAATSEDPKATIENILAQGFEDSLSDQRSKEVIDALQALKPLVDDESGKLVDEAIEACNTTIPTDGFTSFLAERILEKVKNVKMKEEKPAEVAAETSASETKDDTKANKTMRVYEASIDKFLDFVGELVVVGEMYDHIQKRFAEELGLNKAVSDLKKNNETFNDLSTALQRSVLEIRRVPIKTLIQRAPRIIRDVATMRGKKIKVQIEGEEKLIDKSLLESLEGPFVHMVRNSADHGIETPEKRVAAGKPEDGNVLIQITEDEESMFIGIKDDGAGINREIIGNKGVSNGLITQDQADNMSDQEIYMLLFAPGFSTAEQVTDISGRGVGMDVVRRNVEGIGGSIIIESELGAGSNFTIQIPKTVCVKIMEGFLVDVSGERFVLPMTSVGESFKVGDKEITSTPGEGECIMHHNTVFPILRLDKRLDLTGNLKSNRIEQSIEHNDQEKIGVILESGKNKLVLLVDDVLGTQQVVIKDIEGLPGQPEIIAGGAVLGDEQVAIVLNVEKF